jgi:hypothetical protein
MLCRNGRLRHFIEGNERKDMKEGETGCKVITYWMTVREQEVTGN